MCHKVSKNKKSNHGHMTSRKSFYLHVIVIISAQKNAAVKSFYSVKIIVSYHEG